MDLEAIRATCLGTRAAQLHRVITRRYEHELRTVGLSLPQLEILTALAIPDGPTRPADLAATLQLERSTLSRNLALLQDRGWVRPAELSPTGRSMAVDITPAGSTVLTSAHGAWQRAQTEVSDVLGPEAAATLDSWLQLLTPGGERR